jgi:glutaminyl-tRNA synthetase
VLDPLKVVIENYPEDKEEELEAVNNPEDESMGTRMLPFSREIWIERGDFMEDPPRKFFRLAPGREVRLKHAYFITCSEVIRDKDGKVVELRCTYDPETKGGDAPDGRKVRGTLHWVSARHAADATVRLYGRLFTKENPDDAEEGGTFMDHINPDALEELSGCKVEPSLKEPEPGRHFQFLRHGYFCEDIDSSAGALIFNRTVSLRDTWAKIRKKQKKTGE